LAIELNDGAHVRRLRALDFTDHPGGGEWSMRYETAAPDTVQIRLALVQGAGDKDTLATLQAMMPVLPGRGYRILVTIGEARPYGFMNDAVFAAPFRPGAAPQPGDSLFVSWGYYIKGGPPS
jgi:hypothetical protein